MKQLLLKKIIIWVMLTINLLFAFVIGLTIPTLESASHINLGIVMIPLLIILNYVIVDRYHYYLKHSNEREGKNHEKA
ncbi:MAG: archaeosortase H N-terminal-like domain-containing protein [Promethearchaeota archaeon]